MKQDDQIKRQDKHFSSYKGTDSSEIQWQVF